MPTNSTVIRSNFKSHGALAYDDRILHWYTEHGFVSIWTTAGRMKISYQAGERQLHQLQFRQGETDLIYRKGKFYLAATCEIPVLSQSNLRLCWA